MDDRRAGEGKGVAKYVETCHLSSLIAVCDACCYYRLFLIEADERNRRTDGRIYEMG